MKKIKLYTIAAIASLLPLFSCEDFLDLNPTTQPSETTFWKTENDFNMALAGIYGQMRSNIYFNPNRSLEKASCQFLMTAIRKTALYMFGL